MKVIKCTACGQVMAISDSSIGKEVKCGNCGAVVAEQAPPSPAPLPAGARAESQDSSEQKRRELRRKARLPLILGVLLQLIGPALLIVLLVLVGADDDRMFYAGAALVALPGTGIFLYGLAYSMKAKGYHPAFCLLAFFGLVGLVVSAFMPYKKTPHR